MTINIKNTHISILFNSFQANDDCRQPAGGPLLLTWADITTSNYVIKSASP